MRHVSRTAIKVDTTDTRLDLFIASWITTHLVCSSCRSTSVSTGSSNNRILSIKSGTWWSADITLLMRIEHVSERSILMRGNLSFIQTRWLFANNEIYKPLYNYRAQRVSGKNKEPAQTPWRGAQCSRIGCIGLRPALTRGLSQGETEVMGSQLRKANSEKRFEESVHVYTKLEITGKPTQKKPTWNQKILKNCQNTFRSLMFRLFALSFVQGFADAKKG